MTQKNDDLKDRIENNFLNENYTLGITLNEFDEQLNEIVHRETKKN